MNSLFGNTNPLVSPMGQLIERAIDPYNPETNLELFFEVADWINAKEEDSKDAFRSIRKLLATYSGRNWVVVTKILVLLDTCTNNCNRRFQTQLASKEFLNELKHMIGPKNQPPLSVQEKVLALIQHWVTLFKGDSEFKVIESFYAEMRSKGIEFPKYDPEAFTAAATDVALPQNAAVAAGSPKRSPPPSHPQPPQPAANLQNARYQRLNEAHQLPSGGSIRLNEDQMGKLNSELDIVESNVQVLNDVLTHLQQQSNNTKLNDPSNEDVLLAKELSKTCREMQKRITQLIGNVANENTINELLRINDDLNNVFLRYERFERAHNLVDTTSSQENNSFNSSSIPFNAAAAGAATASATAAAASRSISQTKPEEKPLIDFGDSDVVTPKPASADLLADSFQQFGISSSSNNGANKPTQRGGGGGGDEFNSEMNQFLQDENEIKEMEQWFQLQGGASNFGTDDFARSIQPAADASNDNRLNSQVKSDRAPIN